MITDLDRNIFTIKYNLLNLPDTIQFGNGNQIINQYDASGQKLYTRYYTVLYPEAVPIISTLEPGKTLDLEYNMDIVDETGVFYVDNYEYGFNGCDPGWYWISRIHNPEGYFSQEPGTYLTFYYYRKDHLGNNRELWRSSYTYSEGLTVNADTEQQTQYYPSGLPWASNTGDNPGSQPYKYNGKEFVEMHGLDSYDYGARVMYPAIGPRFMSVDPLCEDDPSVSPYVYCHDNPMNRIDPDGRADKKTNKDENTTQANKSNTSFATTLVLGAGAIGQTVGLAASSVLSVITLIMQGDTRLDKAKASTPQQRKEQEKREGAAKRELDQNQANMAAAIKQNTPDRRPDGGSDPKRPLSEWNPITVVVTGIVIAKNIYDNITKPEPVPAPAPAPAPAPTPSLAPPTPTPTPIQPKQPWFLY